jgi:hypothetical protein
VLLVAYLLLGLGVLVGSGTLHGLPYVVVASALLVYEARHDGRLRPRRTAWLVVLGATIVLADSPSPLALVPLTVLQGLTGIAAFVRPGLGGRGMLGASVGLYAIAGAIVITSAPSPRIDVFELQQLGASDLASGHDPYASTFPNPYTPTETRDFFGDDRTELREYPYPPLSLLVTGLGYLAGHDVRWALLASQLAIGVLLYALARGNGHGPDVAGAITSLHFLAARGFYMLEHAWTDSLIAAAFLGVLLAVQRRRERGHDMWLGLALGLFLGFKQYSVVALPLLFRDGRVSRRAWLGGLAAALAVVLPFVVWGPADFVNDVVLFQLRQPFRREALSLPAYLFLVTGWKAPGVLALAGAIGAGAITWRRLGPEQPLLRLGIAAALVYAFFFVFAKQAFCNYYYFEGVLILGAAALLAPDSAPTATGPMTAGPPG